MLPGRFSATQRFAAPCATSQAPRRLVSTTASQSSSGISSAGFTIEMPALLTTMSRGPAASSAFPTDSADCTSSSIDLAAILAPSRSACRDFRRSVRRAASTTDAPASPRQRAKCVPSPDEAPVIKTVLPLRSNGFGLVISSSLSVSRGQSSSRLGDFPPIQAMLRLAFWPPVGYAATRKLLPVAKSMFAFLMPLHEKFHSKTFDRRGRTCSR